MDWTPVDLYCERTDPGLWAEPLNAASNAAFLIAAIFVLRTVRTRGRAIPPLDAALLAALIALVGVGSLLFHTFAAVWAGWLDVLFILVFIYVFLARFLWRVAQLGWLGVAIGLAVYWLGSKAVTAPFPTGSLNGSYGYFPPLLALTALALFAHYRRSAAAHRLAIAAAAFVVSLTFRTVDQALCDAWPLGTHFIWHCLNAVVLYCAATALFTERAGEQYTVGR